MDFVDGSGGTAPDAGWAIAVDASGNAYVTGTYQGTVSFGRFNLTSDGDFSDVFVTKIDPSGTVLWASRFGGAQPDIGSGIGVDGSGNSYVTGYFSATVTFGNSNFSAIGANDIYVMKLDPTGAVLWASRFGASGQDQGIGIAVDGSGNMYITGIFAATVAFGNFNLTSSVGNDIFLLKMDPSGAVLWASRFNGNGSSTEAVWDIAVDAASNTYLTGEYKGTVKFGNFTLTASAFNDIFVTKVDPSGAVLWASSFGGTGNDVGYGISVDASGNSYLTGSYKGTAGDDDIFVTKLDPSGTALWATGFTGAGEDAGLDLCVDGSGNSYITGFFSKTVTFGEYNLTSAGSLDIFVTKVDPSGAALWAAGFGGAGNDQGRSNALDAAGNNYITGLFFGTARFNTVNPTSAGIVDIFVTKLNAPSNQSTSAPSSPPTSLPTSSPSQAALTSKNITLMGA